MRLFFIQHSLIRSFAPMPSTLQKYPVNWIDGMKISRQHFFQTEQFVSDSVRDALALSVPNFGYGLLAESSSFDVQIVCDFSQQININVATCRAITSDGCRVEVKGLGTLSLHSSFKQVMADYRLTPDRDQTIYVALSVNVFEREAFGEPAANEMPPRQPYTQPKYELSLIPAETIQVQSFGGGHLLIGKIRLQNGELRTDTKFIPASMAVSSNQLLVEWYQKFGKILEDIETYSFRIVQKIKIKSQKSSLTDNVQQLTESLIFALSDVLSSFRWRVPQQPPIFLLEAMLRLAYRLQSSLNLLIDRDKEELLAYFGEWSDLTATTIEGQLNALLNATYIHADVAPLFEQTESFFNIVSMLFNKLSQLEFIGKRKGQNVFIVESPVHETQQPIAQPEKPKSRWSPI
jgi:predicted component of type VI protein secretion system